MRRQPPFTKPPPVPLSVRGGTTTQPHTQAPQPPPQPQLSPQVHEIILESPTEQALSPNVDSSASSSRESPSHQPAGRERSPSSFSRGNGPAKDLRECLGCWLTYVQALSGLCMAGLQLSQCLQQVMGGAGAGQGVVAAGQCVSAWEGVTKMVLASSTALRTELLAGLQEAASRIDCDSESVSPPEVVQLLSRNLLAFIQMQYHFCVCCGESLSLIQRPNEEESGGSPGPESSSEVVTPTPSPGGCDAPPPFPQTGNHLAAPRLPLDPLLPRRWSMFSSSSYPGEVTPGCDTLRLGGSVGGGSAPRRWSSPGTQDHYYYGGGGWWGQNRRRSSGSRSSSSGTPDSRKSGFASSDEIQDVINLLSCKLSSSSSPGSESNFSYMSSSSLHEQSLPLWPPSGHLPGVTLTSYSHDASRVGTWPRSGANNGWNESNPPPPPPPPPPPLPHHHQSPRRSSSPWLSPEARMMHRGAHHRSSWPAVPPESGNADFESTMAQQQTSYAVWRSGDVAMPLPVIRGQPRGHLPPRWGGSGGGEDAKARGDGEYTLFGGE